VFKIVTETPVWTGDLMFLRVCLSHWLIHSDKPIKCDIGNMNESLQPCHPVAQDWSSTEGKQA